MSLQPTCPPVHRPELLLDPAATVRGLRGAGAALSGGSRFLDVWLYGDPPPELADPARWTLTPAPGGTPVAVVAAVVDPNPTPHVRLTLAGLPDTARYRLDVVPGGLAFDPLRTWLPVRLRPECPDLGSCVTAPEPPPPRKPSPVHDYLARDWKALRQALLEFLVREDPTADLSIADPQVTVLELYAHVGDLLHYRLDRVATELYLESARLRTSVKRHARLVDYRMSEAVSATAPIVLQTPPLGPDVLVTAGMVATIDPESPGRSPGFTLERGRLVRAALGEIAIHDWSEDACCLPAGATECVLVRPRPADFLGNAWLVKGDLLAFEVVDPLDPARHAGWAHRAPGVDWPVATPAFRDPLPSRAAHVVTLTEVIPYADPLAPGVPLALVRWSPAEALPRSYPVGIDAGAGGDEVTVARSNIVPAHHGRLVDGPLAPRRGGAVSDTGQPVEYSLTAAAADGIALRPSGEPYLFRPRVTLASGLEVTAEWVPTLLSATPGGLYATIDTEEHEPPIARFVTGAVGTPPPFGSTVAAAYEIGGGTDGNVAANALRSLETNTALPEMPPVWEFVAGVTARNPVAATGGLDAVPLDVVRRDAPEAFAADVRRAVVPPDYSAAASELPYVQRALSRREWSGSWPVVTTVVDLLATPGVDSEERLAEIRAALDELRMVGTEAAVVEGAPVGLLVGVSVCARPGVDVEKLRLEVLTVLRGVFSPSRLELGTAVYLSAALAAVAALPGVDAVELTEARRLAEPKGTVHQVIAVGPGELPVLDDDPARPERGRLDVQVRGGSR